MLRPFLILVALTVVGASMLFSADPAPSVPAKSRVNAPKELLEKQLDAARSVFREELMRLQAGEAIFDEKVMLWSERWLDAELSLSDKSTDQVAALKAHLDRIRELEKLAESRARSGQGRTSDAHAANYFRVSAEIRLREATSN